MSDRELPMLAGIGAIIRWIEELASLLAGPVLTLGLGIALVDLFTDGRLLTTEPALLFAWAISQTVGLDAQLVGSAAKLGAALRRRADIAILGYALLVFALGYVAFQASNVFATQQADGITTVQALARLGMDGTAWIIERSALAVVLVILSGLLRYAAPMTTSASLSDERAELERQLELEPLRQQLRKQRVGGWHATVQTALRDASPKQSVQASSGVGQRIEAIESHHRSAALEQTTVTPEPPRGDQPPTGPGSPAVASKPHRPADTLTGENSANVTPLRRGLGRSPRRDKRSTSRINARSGRRGKAEERIRAVLAMEPDITPEALAIRADVSSSSVSKWLAVFRAEQTAAREVAR